MESVIEKRIENGKVAVLVSGGFGAGWSTWNYGCETFLMFDSGLVDMAQRKASADEVEAYLKSKLGDRYYCVLGWGQVRVEWIDIGTEFRIDEYDGAESLTTSSEQP